MVHRRISWLGTPDLDWFFYFQIHKLEGKALEDRWEQIKIHLSDLMIMVLSAAKFLAPVDQIWTLQLSQGFLNYVLIVNHYNKKPQSL